ncbi:MAG: hypothetical protein AAGC55_01085 [Myxococcota bacterium]
MMSLLADPISKLRTPGNVNPQKHKRTKPLAQLVYEIPAALHDLWSIIIHADERVKMAAGHTTRSLRLRLALNRPEFWTDEEIHEDLIQLLSGFFGRRFSLAVAREEESPRHMVPVQWTEYGQHPTIPRAVIAFRDDRDGLVALRAHSWQPCDELVVAALERAIPMRPTQMYRQLQQLSSCPTTRLIVHRASDEVCTDDASSSRLLQLIWATVVAGGLGCRQVLYFENGIDNLQLPVTAQTLAGVAPPTVRPEQAALLEQIVSRAISSPFSLRNPFVALTPAEVMADSLPGDELMTILEEDEPHLTTNHGVMDAAAVDRSVAQLGALLIAGRDEWEHSSRLMHGLITAMNDNVADAYVRAVRELPALSESELCDRLGQIDPPPSEQNGQMIAVSLLRKHAAIVHRVLTGAVRRRADDIVAGTIPATSLLARAAASSDATASLQPSAPSVFRQRGSVWELGYHGCEPIYFKHVSGLSYIHILLSRRHQMCSAIELRWAVTGRQVKRGDNERDRSDDRAVSDYRHVLREHRAELELAQEYNDLSRIERLNAEIDWLEQELSRSLGLCNRPREMGDKNNARNSVCNAIRRALKQITTKNKALARHLDGALRLGSQLCYAPADPIVWLTC